MGESIPRFNTGKIYMWSTLHATSRLVIEVCLLNWSQWLLPNGAWPVQQTCCDSDSFPSASFEACSAATAEVVLKSLVRSHM